MPLADHQTLLPPARSAPATGRLVAIPVDPFRRLPLHWVSVSTDRFVLGLGQGGVALEGQQDYWDVVVISPSGARQLLASKLSLGYAQGRAEDYARSTGAGCVTNAYAQWCQRLLTDYPKVRGKMQWLRIPITEGMTLGQAYDLIDQAELRKRLAAVQEVARGSPQSTPPCTGISVCLQVSPARRTCQTPKDTLVGLALDFLALACFPVPCSPGPPQNLLSFTHSRSDMA